MLNFPKLENSIGSVLSQILMLETQKPYYFIKLDGANQQNNDIFVKTTNQKICHIAALLFAKKARKHTTTKHNKDLLI